MIESKVISPAIAIGSRRRTIRLAASHVKAFATAKMVPIQIEDLSNGGFSAISSQPFEQGSVHVMRFTLGRIAVNTRGEARQCRPIDSGSEQPRFRTRFVFVGQARPDGSTIDELIGAITTSTVSLQFL